MEVIEVRNVNKRKAKKEVLEYLKSHGRAYPSDIADALRLDFDIVISIIKDLLKKGKVKE